MIGNLISSKGDFDISICVYITPLIKVAFNELPFINVVDVMSGLDFACLRNSCQVWMSVDLME